MPLLGSRAAAAIKAFGFAGLVDVIRDTYFNLVSLLLKSNFGAVTDSAKTIDPPFMVDGSSNNLQLVNSGTQPSKLNPYGGNYYSTYLNGSTDEVYFATATPTLPTSTTPFTMEARVYFTAFTGVAIASSAYSSGAIPFVMGMGPSATASGGTTAGAYPTFCYYNGSAWVTGVTTTTALSANTWYHLAYVFTGTNATIYANGVALNTAAVASWQTTAGTAGFHVGRRWDTAGANYISGFVEDFRLVIGTAVYTSNFTPPTAPLTAISGTAILTCQNSRFVDNSSNNYAITLVGTPKISPFTALTLATTPGAVTMNNGSGYFNGGTYMYAPTNTGTVFGTGDFTIELWVYPTSYSVTASQLYDTRPAGTGASATYIIIGLSSAGVPGFTGSTSTSGGVCQLNAWTHLAVTRQGTSIILFVNGTQVGVTLTDSASYTAGANRPMIGTDGNVPLSTGYSLIGYISNVRVLKGVAAYTANFTTPTAPFKSDANTQLLTLQYPGSFLNNQYVDNSFSNAIITANGDVKQGSFSPYSGNWSIYQSVNSTFINATYAANANMLIGTGQFTIEAWIYQPVSAVNQYTIVSNRTYNNTGTGTFSFYVTATTLKFDEVQTPANISTSTATITLGVWQHVAITRDSANSVKIFINGVLASTPVTSAFNFSSTNSYQIGYNSDASNFSFLGYLSNVRVSVGTARYTANFTPQTTPFINDIATTILIGNTGMLKDMSSNNLAITTTGTPTVTRFSPFSGNSLTANNNYFSGAFNGTTDYLLAPYSALFDLSASDWTMEVWFNARSFTASMNIITKDTNGTNFDWGLSIVSATSIGTYTAGIAQSILATVPAMSTNTWYHYAISRSGTTTQVYLNGVSYASANQALTNASASTPTIGCSGYNNPNGFFNGLIYNLRVSKSARYTGASFTIPTSPLTSDSTTSLLLFNDSRIIDGSPNNLVVYNPSTTAQVKVVPMSPLSTQGVTVKLGTSMSPYVMSGSTYFDGTGDYLSIPTNATYDLNTGTPKWTIECWVYLTGATTAYRTFISKRATGGQWELGVNPTNSYLYFYNGTVYLTNIAVLNNTWTHCAAAYDGTTLRMFVNGVYGYSGAVNATAGTDGIFIGAISGGTQTVTGYIGDMKVIRGVAKYTTNFYPPVSPLVNDTGTILLINSTNLGVFDSAGKTDMQLFGNARLSNVQTKYGSSSLYLDGTNSYVVIPARPELDILTGDFTVECWAYPQSAATNQQIIGQWNQTGGQGGYGFGTSAGTFFFSFGAYSEAGNMISSGTYTLNAWYHVAAVRYGSVFTLYVNGVSVGTPITSSATKGALAVNTVLGNYYAAAGTIPASGGNYYQGYIDDLRITKYARYTAAFTPPSTLPENGPSV